MNIAQTLPCRMDGPYSSINQMRDFGNESVMDQVMDALTRSDSNMVLNAPGDLRRAQRLKLLQKHPCALYANRHHSSATNQVEDRF